MVTTMLERLNTEGFRRRIEKRDFIFDENSPNFVKHNEHNVLFIQMMQGYFNDLLALRGHVFLNEVLDQFGISRTVAGQVVGWRLETGPVKNSSDRLPLHSIEFKITQTRFQGQDVREYFLNFNHQGLILFDALGD